MSRGCSDFLGNLDQFVNAVLVRGPQKPQVEVLPMLISG